MVTNRMIERIKYFVMRNIELAVVLTLKLCRAMLHCKGHVLVAAPIVESNLGDEALVSGALCAIRNQSDEHILVIQRSDESPQKAIDLSGVGNVYLSKRYKFAFLTRRSFTDRLKLYFRLFRYKNVVMNGADIMDGTYGDETVLAPALVLLNFQRMGLSTSIIGFSVSENMTDRAKSALIEMDKAGIILNIRDDGSLKRLPFIKNKNLVADVAFLLPPATKLGDEYNVKLTELYDKEIVSISIKQDDLEQRVSAKFFVEFINNFLSQHENRMIYLVPHVTSDVDALRSIYDLLDQKNKKKTLFIDKLTNSREAKLIISLSKVTITGRMHIAIAALSSGVPVVCFPYRDKFHGLLNHFGLNVEKHLHDVQLSQKDSFDDLVNKVNYCLRSNETLKNKITSAKNDVTKIAQHIF